MRQRKQQRLSNINKNKLVAPSLASTTIKRPSVQKPINTKNGTTFLQSYSNAMEQKLQSLKEKIQQKKKQKQFSSANEKQQNNKMKTVQNFAKGAKGNYALLANQQQQQSSNVSYTLIAFLTKLNIVNYLEVLKKNQISTLDILKEASQQELEQIGISKGHALKISVNLKKQSLNNSVQQNSTNKVDHLKEKKPSQKNLISVQNSQQHSQQNVQNRTTHKKTNQQNISQPQKDVVVKKDSICIGTSDNDNDDGIQEIFFSNQAKSSSTTSVRNKFCLFCYTSFSRNNNNNNNLSKQNNLSQQFCTQICQQKYGLMFQKYENNLIKAENQFKKKSSLNAPHVVDVDVGAVEKQESNEQQQHDQISVKKKWKKQGSQNEEEDDDDVDFYDFLGGQDDFQQEKDSESNNNGNKAETHTYRISKTTNNVYSEKEEKFNRKLYENLKRMLSQDD